MKKIRSLLILIMLFIGFITSTHCKGQTSGKASYYSNNLHGRRMSNGQVYNKNDFTCAHRTLPFGTRLKVTNPRSGKTITVRVADRGPFVRGRIIDLSYAAARALGIISSGVGYVRIEVMRNKTEIPYPSPDIDKTIEVPEVEYGLAGVCYEFIPEWEKAKDDKPEEVERKVNTKGLSRKAAVSYNKNKAFRRYQQQETMKSSSKEGASKSWTDFFNKVKNGVTGIFE